MGKNKKMSPNKFKKFKEALEGYGIDVSDNERYGSIWSEMEDRGAENIYDVYDKEEMRSWYAREIEDFAEDIYDAEDFEDLLPEDIKNLLKRLR